MGRRQTARLALGIEEAGGALGLAETLSPPLLSRSVERQTNVYVCGPDGRGSRGCDYFNLDTKGLVSTLTSRASDEQMA